MDLLNKPINSFSFANIEAFCKEKHSEGIQLDYKRDGSLKDLAKHFASFSNTRGGVIIFGVDEDDKTGCPRSFDGVTDIATLVEKIHQTASNVDPLPSYEFHVTNYEKGKAFVLLRIYEGIKPPHYVQNSPHIYVRTGNITNPINYASSSVVQRLFSRRDKAEDLVSYGLERVLQVVELVKIRSTEEYLKCKKEASNAGSENVLGVIGDNPGILDLVIQPYHAIEPLTERVNLIDKINEYSVSDRNYGYQFPCLDQPLTLPGGVSASWYAGDGGLDLTQVYTNGLIAWRNSITRFNPSNGNSLDVSIHRLASYIFSFLTAAHKFYDFFGYQGILVFHVFCRRMGGVYGISLQPGGYSSELSLIRQQVLVPTFDWRRDFDTTIFKNKASFSAFYTPLLEEISWCFGYRILPSDVVDVFLEKDLNWGQYFSD